MPTRTPEDKVQIVRQAMEEQLRQAGFAPKVIHERRPQLIEIQRPEDATPRRVLGKVCTTGQHWFGFPRPKSGTPFSLKSKADFVLFASAVFATKKDTMPQSIRMWLVPVSEVIPFYQAIEDAYVAREKTDRVPLWANVGAVPATPAYDACQANLMAGKPPTWEVPFDAAPVPADKPRADGALREQVARLSWTELQTVIRDYWSEKTGQPPANIDIAVTFRS